MKTRPTLSETCGDYKQMFFPLNPITEETFHFAMKIKFGAETWLAMGRDDSKVKQPAVPQPS
ncbi:hypothetical protein QM327_07200 [Pantoea dispersa]|uniref:hypothetical protein n=1 Tax=Pantoea dispersa TaxID=59814 RepID=UPI00241F6035|nr:hypothetical protein [Pantoea dispersa]MDI9766340.1 hypothetical protein [Pantoea dispersa]